MAHHQGMSLLAFDNALHGSIMRQRFHSVPRIRATEPLLHGHIPERILPTTGDVREDPARCRGRLLSRSCGRLHKRPTFLHRASICFRTAPARSRSPIRAADTCAGSIWISRAGARISPAISREQSVTSGIWIPARSGATHINRSALPSGAIRGVSPRTRRSSGAGADRARR